ncbi:MAG: VacJ family lipoprotein [Magnetococcales bacterium]|nr:VacJ family lipoprotein [Magnetococcales bacterium]
MKRIFLPLALALFFFLPIYVGGAYADSADNDNSGKIVEEDFWSQNTPEEAVSDPLEPWNRFMFGVNDVLYYSILKPVGKAYSNVVTEDGRVMVRNFFHNLTMPIHVVNALLQGKVKQAGVELGRFGINTVMGGLGLFDVADMHFDLKSADEDLGQTFGTWGAGDSVYLVWPLLGPSNARDTIGKVGDTFMNPTTYVPDNAWTRAAIFAFKTVNNTSLRIGEYESLTEPAVDPYIAVRDAYRQFRRKQISQ